MAWSAPEDWSRWDPEKLLVCPYDEVHRIKAKRFQKHLLKCRENHPEKDFVTCPFNAKHVMLRSEIRHHVSRCPDRTVIEQYNYKGSEKDEDGFYFKGNTSVPSYHKTEDIQESSESWDAGEESNFHWTEHNEINTPQWKQGTTQTSHVVTDTLSLSPEEREKFKRQMRREAAIRNANSGMLLPSQRWASSQGYNKSSDNYMMEHSLPTNVGQSAMANSSVQEVEPVVHTGVLTNTASKQRNPIFEYCVQRMQNSSECANKQNMVVSQSGACKKEEVMNESNLTLQRFTNEGVSSHHPRNTVLTSFTHDNMKLRSNFANSGMENRSVLQGARGKEGEVAISNVCGRQNLLTSSQQTNSFSQESSAIDPMELTAGFIENEMEKTLRLHGNTAKPEVAAVSSVCGQPTYPTSSFANSPHLAGVGRARHFAEARKNNFGGICYNPPKNAGLGAARPASAGRGRGMLNYFTYSS